MKVFSYQRVKNRFNIDCITSRLLLFVVQYFRNLFMIFRDAPCSVSCNDSLLSRVLCLWPKAALSHVSNPELANAKSLSKRRQSQQHTTCYQPCVPRNEKWLQKQRSRLTLLREEIKEINSEHRKTALITSELWRKKAKTTPRVTAIHGRRKTPPNCIENKSGNLFQVEAPEPSIRAKRINSYSFI